MNRTTVLSRSNLFLFPLPDSGPTLSLSLAVPNGPHNTSVVTSRHNISDVTTPTMDSSYAIDPNSRSWHYPHSLMYRLYTLPDGVTEHIPAILEGFPRANASIGSTIGEVGSRYTADAFGGRTSYGIQLVLTILALTLTAPMASRSPNHSILYRFLQDLARCGRWRRLSDERDDY
ncbi:hypothetical protein D9619_010152 [Psilocybe cf. subviscida]|uniref:Uncharacterized protein n=1 Tax=Psilocybe cf. subviscida TaxID=2480587 RepID=A0A8H5ESC1_9AGAR|nr:hypothetical protein D9619_010152 [Psilocybe cf. subviscida]